MRDFAVPTASGGVLQVRDAGDPPDVPIFGLHGSPGSRIMPREFVTHARAKGIRLITYDRPGYGGSTPAPGRRIADAAREVATIAESLGLERYGVWGISGGGPTALACAATSPARVFAAASLGGPAPFAAEGLEWFAGMGELNVADFQLMRTDQRAWERKNRSERDELMASTPAQLRERWASLLSEVDRRGLTDELAEFMTSTIREGLRPGDEGLRDDTLSQAEPWGFHPRSIGVPVQIWHGGQDRFVPLSHGEWLAKCIPAAQSHLLPNEGHLTVIFQHVPDAQSWIAAHA